MGFLDRLFGKKQTIQIVIREGRDEADRPEVEVVDARGELPPDVVLLGGQGRVQVKGEAQCQDALDQICGGKCEAGHGVKVHAILVPQPDNPYDSNAVAVYVNDLRVGYMAKESAAEYQPVFKKLAEHNRRAAARAYISGGWRRSSGDEGHYGITLELSSVEVLMKSKKLTKL